MRSSIALAAFAASQSYAQTSYSTETYTSCETADTVTGTKWSTLPCTHSACTETSQPIDGARSGHMTTWVTSYTSLCPTESANNYQKVITTTVTESCSEATPTWSHTNANYVPSSWTTGKVVCTECGSAGATMSGTYPVAMAPSGTIVPQHQQAPAAAPGSSGPMATSPAMPGSGGSGSSPGSSPPGSGSSANPGAAAPAAAPGMPAAAASPAPGSPMGSSPMDSAPAMDSSPMGSAPAMDSAPMDSAPMDSSPAGSAPEAMAPAPGMPGTAPEATAPASGPGMAAPGSHENMPAAATPLMGGNSSSPTAYHGGAGTLSQPLAAALSLVVAVAAAMFML